MDLDTSRSVGEIRPITRSTDAEEVALAAHRRFVDQLARLEPDDWTRPTECTGWDVADVAGHVLGAGESCASVRQLVRQQVWGARHAADFGGNALDATNALQVREHAELAPAARIAALRDIAPAAVRGRMRVPRPLRRIQLPIDQGGSTAPGMPTRLSLAELMDVIYTRDVWLHTIDVARATGSPYQPEPGVDGRIVEDVVAAWAQRHGAPFRLTLTGPAGGRFHAGDAGPDLHLDAVAFCRILSGRAEPDDGEVEVRADPSASDLLRTRVLF